VAHFKTLFIPALDSNSVPRKSPDHYACLPLECYVFRWDRFAGSVRGMRRQDDVTRGTASLLPNCSQVSAAEAGHAMQ
jgi:hypothetical protein